VRWFQHLFAFRQKVDPGRYYCVDYRDLTRDPHGTLEAIYRHFGWTMSVPFQEKLAQLNGQQQEFQSNHSYSLEEFGLTKEWIRQELGPVLDYYKLNGSTELRAGSSAPAPSRAGQARPASADQARP
jgi:hypothetical protein